MTVHKKDEQTEENFIQKGGAATFHLETALEPQEFYFLLLPKATMLAIAAAIEPLRVANQVTNQPLYRWYTMSETGAQISCSNGMRILPDMALGALPDAATAFICAGVEPQESASPAVLNWIRREHRFGRTLGGICTGAYALAEAGVIGNRPFTLHWEDQPGFLEQFEGLQPSPSIFEITDRLMTCGGGNAATDLMLALIEARHGKQLALIVADMCLHLRSSSSAAPQKSNYAVAIGSRNQRLLSALQLMQETIQEPLSIGELCTRLGISRRQLERLFARYLDESPMQIYSDMRLSHAYGLMNETALSVTEIALASGFNSATHFSRQFKRKFGASPHFFRKGWS